MIRHLAVLAILVSQLHLLRNVTPIYALAYACVIGLFVVLASVTATRLDKQSRYLLKLIALIYTLPIVAILPGIISEAPYGFSSLVVGTARLLFTVPIFVVVLWLPRTQANLRALAATAGILTVAAALTIPYQFVTGPIWWFADSSERAGLFRFASLLGSLTTLGAVCGMGIVLCAYAFRSTTIASLAIVCVTVGSILSLSKAAVVNVVLAISVIPLVRRPTTRELSVLATMLTVGGVAAVATFGDKLLAFWRAFRLTDQSSSSGADDVSLVQSILDRLTALPLEAVSFHGKLTVFFGVGPIGGGGNLGYTEVPTVHNGLVELLLVGGVPLLCAYIWLNTRAVAAGLTLLQDPNSKQDGVVGLFLIGNSFANVTFGSGGLFSPIGALLLAIGLKLLSPGISMTALATRAA